MKTIGIFPASGKLGGSTMRHLLDLVPYHNVILICRHPEKLPAEYVQGGVRVRQVSYEASGDALAAAFADIDVLFVISFPSHVHAYRTKVHLSAVDAARRAGVRHVLYSSLAFAGKAESRQSRAVVMQAHLDTEKHLRELAAAADQHGLDPPFRFTAIREGLYAESVPIYTAFFDPANDAADEIRIPHDGSGPGVAWVKIDDLGEASARLIAAAAADEGEIQANPALISAAQYLAASDTVLLTGSRAWTLAETVVAVFGGTKTPGRTRTVHICEVSVDEYVSQPAVQAVFGSADDSQKARTWATAWDAIRSGETAVVTKALPEILGRAPSRVFGDASPETGGAKVSSRNE